MVQMTPTDCFGAFGRWLGCSRPGLAASPISYGKLLVGGQSDPAPMPANRLDVLEFRACPAKPGSSLGDFHVHDGRSEAFRIRLTNQPSDLECERMLQGDYFAIRLDRDDREAPSGRGQRLKNARDGRQGSLVTGKQHPVRRLGGPPARPGHADTRACHRGFGPVSARAGGSMEHEVDVECAGPGIDAADRVFAGGRFVLRRNILCQPVATPNRPERFLVGRRKEQTHVQVVVRGEPREIIPLEADTPHMGRQIHDLRRLDLAEIGEPLAGLQARPFDDRRLRLRELQHMRGEESREIFELRLVGRARLQRERLIAGMQCRLSGPNARHGRAPRS